MFDSLILGLHLFTAHLDPSLAAGNVPIECNGGHYNDTNPGAYARTADGWQAGAYRNSRCRTTVYAGRAWETRCGPLHCGVGAFGATGYPAGRIIPIVAPSVRYGIACLSFTPRIGNKASAIVHLSFEYQPKEPTP
jgi:hypothetical protein